MRGTDNATTAIIIIAVIVAVILALSGCDRNLLSGEVECSEDQPFSECLESNPMKSRRMVCENPSIAEPCLVTCKRARRYAVVFSWRAYWEFACECPGASSVLSCQTLDL